jgi:hypothetical protein
MYDGYVISGAIGPLQMLTKDEVQKFICPYRPTNPMLDAKNPVTVGPFDGLHGWYFEHKVAQNRAMDRSFKVIQDVADEYAELSGRKYGLLDPYRLDDAEIAIVVVGSTAGTTRMTVDKLRARGVKAGMVRVRAFRPFLTRVRQGPSTSRSWASWTAPIRSARRAAPSSWKSERALRLRPRPQVRRSSTASAGATSSPTTSSRLRRARERAQRRCGLHGRRYLNLRKD